MMTETRGARREEKQKSILTKKVENEGQEHKIYKEEEDEGNNWVKKAI